MGNKREIYFKVSDYVKSEVRKVYGQEVDKGVLIVENETWFGGNENVIKKWAKKVNLLSSELQALLWLYSKQQYGIKI